MGELIQLGGQGKRQALTLSIQAVDPLDFWYEACQQSQQGDYVRATSSHVHHWRHIDALAHRVGFVHVEDEDPMGHVWRNERHENSATIGWVKPGDFESWRRLFELCFGHVVQENFWNWKYRDTVSPGIGVWVDGDLIAFYGGMPREIFHGHKKYLAIQVGDVMVHPKHRASLSRTGPFQMAASTFLEQQLSVGSPHWIGFGFPNQRAMQVARRLRLYRPVDEVVELRWTSKEKHMRTPWWLALRPLVAINKVQQAWDKMCRSMPDTLLGRRDQAYVRERYLQHPHFKYQLVEVYNRLTRKIVGVVVFAQQSDQRIEVLDLIGARRDMPLLIDCLSSWVQNLNVSGVYMWLTRSHLHWLSASMPEVVDIGVQIPTNDWVPGNAYLDPAGRWWLTGGDTDFR